MKPPTSSRPPRPLLLVGVGALVAVVAASWAGLTRMGLDLGGPPPGGHGPLMTLGFLGTVIAAERAVGLGRSWAWVPALLSGAAVFVLLVGFWVIAAVLLAAAGLLLVIVYLVAASLAGWEAHLLVMGLGAVGWVTAAAGLVWQQPVPLTVPALVGFLVLTIIGERLELSRMLRPRSPWWRRILLAGALLVTASAVVAYWDLSLAARSVGVSLVVLAVVSVAGDVARRTIRGRGVTRYMAAALLAGYVWLIVAGAVWAVAGLAPGTPLYDVAVHTVLIGFVLSMVFAHAPVIVPAVARIDLPYHPSWWAALTLLHLSLLTRVVGALGDWPALHTWGGVANVTALALFAALAVLSAALGRRPAA
jgi:hypothetical protein